MASCPKCGNAVSSSDGVCPSCGASTRNLGGSRGQQQVSYVKELKTTFRPTYVSVLSGVSAIGGIGAFLLAGGVLPKVGALIGLGAAASAIPYFLGLVGIISLGAAFGFFEAKSWAWKVGLVASLLEIVSVISPNILGLVVGVASLYLMTNGQVKHWLHK